MVYRRERGYPMNDPESTQGTALNTERIANAGAVRDEQAIGSEPPLSDTPTDQSAQAA